MPLFEYRCGGCAHEFELLLQQSGEPSPCPACGSSDLNRILSPSAVRPEQTRRRPSQEIRARNRATRRDHTEAEARRIEAHYRDHDA